MDIEDLKSGWQSLSDRLAETEKLNKRIINEMIRKRTVSAYRKIVYFDLFGIFIILMLLVYFCLDLLKEKPTFSLYTLCILITFLSAGLVVQGISLYYLNHFNIESNKLVESGKWMMKYRWLNKKSEMYVPAIVAIVLIAGFTFEFQRSLFSLTEIIVRCVLGFLIGTVLFKVSIRYFNNNFRDIEDGLKELDELEKE